MKDCLFCKIVRGEIPAMLEYEDEEVLAFQDIHPQAPLHILVVPKKHIERVADMTEEDIPVAGRLVFAAKKIAEKKHMTEKGFRLVFNSGVEAGQSVFHIHLHLLSGRRMNWPPG
ncbi:MAG TPA: histidine triad nucleotide-binding protein [Candidatus Omnitrophota bacterium]|nr:histidine triad nucleotide-binding protein [Candidatus Omnitrophota bacterium]